MAGTVTPNLSAKDSNPLAGVILEFDEAIDSVATDSNPLAGVIQFRARQTASLSPDSNPLAGVIL